MGKKIRRRGRKNWGGARTGFTKGSKKLYACKTAGKDLLPAYLLSKPNEKISISPPFLSYRTKEVK
jgi:hypothetical protein